MFDKWSGQSCGGVSLHVADPNSYRPLLTSITVMNEILGGGGFSSRITRRVRSDEGLAYSAGSRFGIGTYWPATFRVSYQSKNETVAYAANLEKVADDEVRDGYRRLLEAERGALGR